ncbi:MAG: hypothetical protein OXC80_12325 [Gammaproteobacteria bacterium]|nr:hypothetical protein [Gammaproteobacteria bacterium]
MTVLESTLATALEAAIRTRVAFDPKSKEAVTNLDGKRIGLNMSEQRLMVSFDDGVVKVATESEEEAHMELTGSMASISQALVNTINDNVVLVGDMSLLEDFRRIFRTPLKTNDITQATKATADWGIAAAKSAFEMASSQFENIRATRTSKGDLLERVEALEAQQEQLADRIKDLENR